MGEIIIRTLDFREWNVQVNLPSLICQVPVPIRWVITPVRGLLNPIRQVVLQISHTHSYPPYRSHLHPPFLCVLSTTLSSSQNTKLNHLYLSLHAMIMSKHRVQHYTECSVHGVQHTTSTAYTLDCPVSRYFTITSCPLKVTSASSMPPYRLTATSQRSVRAHR